MCAHASPRFVRPKLCLFWVWSHLHLWIVQPFQNFIGLAQCICCLTAPGRELVLCAGVAATVIDEKFEGTIMTSFLKSVFAPTFGTSGRAPSFNDFSLHVGSDGGPLACGILVQTVMRLTSLCYDV
jgi:hypothetical protein